jgi:Flp pilus assembly protein TadD
VGTAARAAALTVALFTLTAALSGCQTSNERTTAHPGAKNAVPSAGDAFDAGANQPPKASTLYSLAKILAVQGRDPEAITVLRTLIQRYPDFSPAYNALAEAHLRADRSADAVAALAAGLERRPNDPVLLNNLGMAWFLQGEYERALDHFRRAAASQPREQTYVLNQAMALGMLGRTDEAAAIYDEHLEPSDARNNLRVLAKARAAAAARREAIDEPSAPPDTGTATMPVVDDGGA